MRRRRRVLGLVALLALVTGVATGALGGGDDGDERSPAVRAGAKGLLVQMDDAVAGMSVERQVGQLLVIAFRGTTAPPYVLRALREGRAAGVILFGANAPDAASVRALTARLPA